MSRTRTLDVVITGSLDSLRVIRVTGSFPRLIHIGEGLRLSPMFRLAQQLQPLVPRLIDNRKDDG